MPSITFCHPQFPVLNSQSSFVTTLAHKSSIATHVPSLASASFYNWVGSNTCWLSWRDIMVQMNHKLAIASILFAMEGWEHMLSWSKFRLCTSDCTLHLNPFPGILWRIGRRTLLVSLTRNVAVHQHGGMILVVWQTFLQNSSTMINGGILHVKLLRGSPLRNFTYSSAQLSLVCKVICHPVSFTGP